MSDAPTIYPDSWAASIKEIDSILYGDLEEITSTPAVPSHQCPHCNRDRHAEPLTRQVAQMYDHHQFRADYSPDDDDSPIVCVGADYHGPNRPAPHYSSWTTVGYLLDSSSWTVQFAEIENAWKKLSAKLEWPKWTIWTTDYTSLWTSYPTPEPLHPCEAPDISVTFGVWKPWEKASIKTLDEWESARKGVPHLFAHAADFPVPERPGYDFSEYAEDEKPYYLKDKK